MARCPICNKNNVVGEQLDNSDILLGMMCYQCPHCGTFRIDEQAGMISSQLDDVAVCRLLDWICNKNRLKTIPVINTTHVSGLQWDGHGFGLRHRKAVA